ncbi:glycosyltransferase family 2 protein [Christiangramia sp. SM2212]|uniref:Glycosyltransferase family 2 protein n=1 Tax=Christiangramia sediminicola TaxID=3073267 RepID=A0ABU1EMV3_9FLAO|nr:glycosyltransferase family 2 protein [Christiangramia sp. SM2212]MDR5589707.1 glycosyltransferase family 2 protein [Christiangramia sp. SM2212]
MPVYNRENLVIESLESILKQTYMNWECLIVDDHSTDRTEAVIKNFIKKDHRFKLFKRPSSKNKGANSCRNFGLEKSNGEFIHWFDSDDVAHPECLRISLEEVLKSGLSFCRFGRKLFFGDFNNNLIQPVDKYDRKVITQSNLSQILKNELEFNTCNVLWRKRDLLDERFNEEIVYADEWEYYSRLFSEGVKGISIDVNLFFGRKHNSSTTYEFHSSNQNRVKSKIKATKLVIKNLGEKKLIDGVLTDYFIKLAFMLKSKEILYLILEYSRFNRTKIFKYKFGFEFYPVLRPILKLKGKIMN